jgi:hypothetical protein
MDKIKMTLATAPGALRASALSTPPSSLVRDYGIDPLSLSDKPHYPNLMRSQLTALARQKYGSRGVQAVQYALEKGFSVEEALEHF